MSSRGRQSAIASWLVETREHTQEKGQTRLQCTKNMVPWLAKGRDVKRCHRCLATSSSIKLTRKFLRREFIRVSKVSYKGVSSKVSYKIIRKAMIG